MLFYCYSVAENKHEAIWSVRCAVSKVEIEAKNAFNCATKCASFQVLVYWAFSMPTNGMTFPFSIVSPVWRCWRLWLCTSLSTWGGVWAVWGARRWRTWRWPGSRGSPPSSCSSCSLHSRFRQQKSECFEFLTFLSRKMIMKVILKRRWIDPIMDDGSFHSNSSLNHQIEL